MSALDHPRTAAAPDEMRDYAAQLITRFGACEACRMLGISKYALMAVAAGAPVNAGTRAMVREAMRAKGEL